MHQKVKKMYMDAFCNHLDNYRGYWSIQEMTSLIDDDEEKDKVELRNILKEALKEKLPTLYPLISGMIY